MRVKEPKATRATVPSTDAANDDDDMVDHRFSVDDEDTNPDGGPVFDSCDSFGFDSAFDNSLDLSMEPDLDPFDERPPVDARAIGEAVRQGTYRANPRAIAEQMLALAALKPTN
jgi:hypothetical protein